MSLLHPFKGLRNADGTLNVHKIERIVIVKSIVMVGLLSAYLLPPGHAMLVNAISNVIWLWKT